MTDPDDMPETWAELPTDLRKAIIRNANSILWWDQLFARLERMKGLATVLMALVMFVAFAREQIAEFALWIGEKLGGTGNVR